MPRKPFYTEEKPMSEDRAMKYRQLGLNIAYYRKLRGMTQQTLAEVSGLSRTHVSNLEATNMHTSVSLDALFNIADALDVNVSDFFDFR